MYNRHSVPLQRTHSFVCLSVLFLRRRSRVQTTIAAILDLGVKRAVANAIAFGFSSVRRTLGGKHAVGAEGQCLNIDGVFDESKVREMATVVDGVRRRMFSTIREAVEEIEKPAPTSNMGKALKLLEFMESGCAKQRVEVVMKEEWKNAISGFKEVKTE
jgi:hypothetical protein